MLYRSLDYHGGARYPQASRAASGMPTETHSTPRQHAPVSVTHGCAQPGVAEVAGVELALAVSEPVAVALRSA